MADFSSVPDTSLITAIRGGDVTAFDELVRRYYRLLAEFATWHAGSPDLADDVVQDVLLAVWERRDRLLIGESVRGYLYTSVRNRAANYLASERARHHREQESAHHLRPVSAPADAELTEHDLAMAVAAAIEALPERCREVFVLVRDHGLSYAETADVLKVAQSTVRNQMARALELLELRLAKVFESQ